MINICNHKGCAFKGIDKWKHYGVCLGISLVSTIAAIGAALWKEYKDSKTPGNHWCWNDILADGLGVITGTSIRCLILYLIFA